MPDTEKLTALKKACADTILNSAKEAAGRVMVSEKRACRYQHELLSVKEGARQMFMRLKQMLDAKVKESEMESLDKQKKIEELEAQLGEAEDIVEELRSEIRGLHRKIEKLTYSQVQSPVDLRNLSEETGEMPVSSAARDKTSLHTSEAVISSPYDMKCLILDGKYNMGPCSYKGNGYACSQSLPALEKLDDVKGEPLFTAAEEEGKDDQSEVEVIAVESSSRKSKRLKSQSSSSFSDSDTCQEVSGNGEIGHHLSPINADANSGEEDSRAIKNQTEDDQGLRNSDNGTVETSKTDLKAATATSDMSGSPKEIVFSWEDKRCIKYTFKRKRRKVSLISQERDLLADVEKENSLCGDLKSGSVTEPALE